MAEVLGGQRRADQDQRAALGWRLRHFGGDVVERAADDALLGPGGAVDHCHRAPGAVVGQQAGDDVFEHVDRQVQRERRAGGGEALQFLARRHRRGASGSPRQHQRLRDFGQGQLAFEHGGGSGKRRHARRHRVGDAEPVEFAQLLAHRAPDRQVARMQARDVEPRLVGGDHLGDDFFEAHRRRVDDARAGRTPAEHRRVDQRSRVEADRAGADQVAAANGDEVGSAGTGADEVDGHFRIPVRGWRRILLPRARRVRSARAWPGQRPARRREVRGQRG